MGDDPDLEVSEDIWIVEVEAVKQEENWWLADEVDDDISLPDALADENWDGNDEGMPGKVEMA